MTHPWAVIVCKGLVLNDEGGEEAEEEGAHQFTAHHLFGFIGALYSYILYFVFLSFLFILAFFCLFLSFCLSPPAASAGSAMEDDTQHWRGPEVQVSFKPKQYYHLNLVYHIQESYLYLYLYLYLFLYFFVFVLVSIDRNSFYKGQLLYFPALPISRPTAVILILKITRTETMK